MKYENIKKYSLELITITCGIFIALFVNNCNETNKKENAMKEIINLIHLETKYNIEEVRKTLTKTQIAIDSTKKYLKYDKLKIGDLMEKIGGLSFPSINNFSYKILPTPDIKFLANYWDSFTILSEIDELKSIIKNHSSQFSTFFLNYYKDTSVDSKEKFLILITELHSYKEQMLDKLEIFNKKIQTLEN